MLYKESNTVNICDCTGETIAWKTAERRDRENKRESRKSGRQRIVEKGIRIGHKIDHWSNFSGFRMDTPWELISVLSRW
jgi:hypothetical protein